MSQATDWSVPLTGPCPPDEFADRIDKSLDALLSSHAGSARPAYAVAGTVWLSTAVAGKLKYYVYDGASDRLIKTVDIATGAITYEGGTLAGPLDMAFNAILNPAGVQLTKFMTGLKLANNATDSTNDLDIAAGAAASEATTPALIILSAGLTKRLDANWAVGSGNGGRYSGAAITDTTYHAWLVSKSDGTGTDVYLDQSASVATVLSHIQAETGGALYTRATRIGSIIRSGGTILAFTHVGRNKFILNVAFAARNSTAALASSLLTFAVPGGIQCAPLLQTRMDWNANSAAQISFGSTSAGGATTAVSVAGGASAGNSLATFGADFLTNTSQQIYASQTILTGSLTVGQILNYGWIDTFL